MSASRLPQIDIELDGAPLAEPVARGFAELRVSQKLSQPTLCELAFFEVSGQHLDSAFIPGASLRVSVRDAAEELFAGRVTAVEYAYDAARGREVRVRGYDLLHALRARQKVRAHVQVTLPELAQELVADMGLAVRTETAGPVWHRLLQTRSDFEMLADLAERCGLYFVLRGKVMHLLTLEGIGESTALRMGEQLLEGRVEINSVGACRTVTATGWDPWHGLPHEAGATTPRAGCRVAQEAPPSGVGGSDERTLVSVLVQDDTQANALAQANLDASTAQEVTLWAVAKGDPQLRPGARVEIEGIAAGVAGEYVLAMVTHTMDVNRGFVSEISSALPPRRQRLSGHAMTIGVVTKVEDPEHLGRIQVALPGLGNVETDWLQVLAPGAGRGKGLLALPDVSDTVLLLMAEDDLAQAVVIGALYGARGLPQGEDRMGASASFTFLSPGGQRLRLDDAARTLRLENCLGSFVELTPDLVRLHAASALTIEAPGQRVLIRGKTIDFDHA